jgi:polyhydroxybutyrate depolymerase
MDKFTGGLNPVADREGFIVAYPDGVDKQWNDGREIFAAANIDDVGFLSTLIDHIARRYNIDPGRVYATGISNGGLMSFRLACDLSEKVTAVAAVTAALSDDLLRHCSPSQPVSVLLINGTQDPLVPWGGGQIKVGRQERGTVISTPDSIQFWVTQNHCWGPPNVSWEPDVNLKDGTRVRREAYEGCRDGTEVVLYAVEGGGHTWPGGQQYLPKSLIGRTSRDIDANELIWHFFEGNSARRTTPDK